MKGRDKMDKQYLKDYVKLREEIECEQCRLLMLESKITGMSGKSNDGMPKGSAGEFDRMTLQIANKIDIENNLKKLYQEEAQKRKSIEAAVNNLLEHPYEKMVIRLKYIDGLSWQTICSVIYSRKGDYIEEQDKYMRNIYRIHGRALIKLSKKAK
jgi:hypothetical protein